MPLSQRGLLGCRLLLRPLLALSCVSGEDTQLSALALCPGSSSEQASSAVVLVSSRMQEGYLRCSGVVIAPTLVVTSLACAYRPSSLGDPDATVRSASTLFYASLDFARACDAARDWAPLEDGSFSAMFGKPLDPATMSVFVASDVEHPVPVKNVFASGATSPCSPGLALLELEREMNVHPLPLRLEDGPLGEAVSLRGHCLEGRSTEAHLQSSTVEAMTSDVGSEQAPPRSMVLPVGSRDTDIGGAVVSAHTGALLGVIVAGTGLACAGPDPAARTFAVRMAAFRSLLLETARARGIDLRVEAFVSSVPDPDIPACREPLQQP